jgi:hypothetical protein
MSIDEFRWGGKQYFRNDGSFRAFLEQTKEAYSTTARMPTGITNTPAIRLPCAR